MNAAKSLISTGVEKEGIQDDGEPDAPRTNLSLYQVEMAASEPDLDVAAIYLGRAAQKEVTPTAVEKVNDILGIQVSSADILAIAAKAEEERLLSDKGHGHDSPDDPGDGDDPGNGDEPGDGDDPGDGGGPGDAGDDDGDDGDDGRGGGGGRDNEPGRDRGDDDRGREGQMRQGTSDAGGGGFQLGRAEESPRSRCADIAGVRLKVKDRISGRNQSRLSEASRFLWPGSGEYKTEAQSPIYILAEFQEELEKSEPDLHVAGAYLGLVSARPLEPRLVRELASFLCVDITDEQAIRIATVAEMQRQQASGKDSGEPAQR